MQLLLISVDINDEVFYLFILLCACVHSIEVAVVKFELHDHEYWVVMNKMNLTTNPI